MKSNFFPLKFAFEDFHVQRLPYRDGLLQTLRQQHNATHSFFRREDFIYISPGVPDTETLGETVRLSVQEHPWVVSSLVKHVFFRTVKDAKPNLRPEFYPFRFAAIKEDFDLARRQLPSELQGILTFKHITEVQFRHYANHDTELVFGALINHRYRWNLSRTCQELAEAGFDLVGREVYGLQHAEYSDGVVAPEISLLGPVRRIQDGFATVDTSGGASDYALEELHLRTSRDNIAAFLAWHLNDERRADAILNAVRAAEAQRLKPDVAMREIEAFGRWLGQLDYRNYDSFGFQFSLDNMVRPPQGFAPLTEPSLIFNVDRTRVHAMPSQGLLDFGPYSRSVGFASNSPRVLVIYHRQHEGVYTRFLAELRDGIPGHRWFAGGMLGKYRLTSMSFHQEALEDYSVQSYLNAIDKAVGETGESFDLAILETQERFRALPDATNPYFQAKAALYQQGTCVQFIKPDIASNPEHSIDGIALQLYAKLGGTPWTVPVDPNVDRELVIGIGSTTLRSSAYAGAAQSRFVGISTFFAADGKYLANSRTQGVSYDQYFDELLRSLKEALNRFAAEYAWQPEYRIRLIFHIFKPVNNIEVGVVSRLVEEYPQYNIRFAFVTIAERHPYLLYDENQAGNYGKGAFVPTRGYTMPLGPHQCLLHLLGTREVRTARHGAFTPVLISIHERSTFVDMQYIVQQVFKFSRLSFRSFTPSGAPATLLYANLLTRQLKHLRSIATWNPGQANAQLRDKKWFL